MLKLHRNRAFGPMLVAIVSVVLATLVTCQWTTLRNVHSMAIYTIAVVISAGYGGIWPAIASIVLSAVSFAYFIAPPVGFAIDKPEDRIRLVSFLVVALFFSFLHSARMTAERKVRSMVQRLKLALEGTKMGLWDLSLDTGVVWHSQSMEEIYGRRGDRFSQAYEVFIGYVHPEDRDFVHRTFTHSIEHGEEFHVQYRILMPEGDARWVSTRGRIFFDAKGRPERLVAATTDMTNRPGAAMTPAAAKLAMAPSAAALHEALVHKAG
jgi:PAS domain S-box-containing protein